MAPPVVYRVPRRFVTFPEDPPPYGFLAVSVLAHLACFGAALTLSAFVGSRMDQSKVYVVNLVPATPALGSPTAAPPAPTVRAPEAPRPTPPAPKAEEKAPPKAARPEPPRPERPPEQRVVEPPPPRDPEVAAVRPKTLEPSELALPRRAEKENPTLAPPTRTIERSLPPPPPVTPPVAAPADPGRPTAAARPAADRGAAHRAGGADGPGGPGRAAHDPRPEPGGGGAAAARPAQRSVRLREQSLGGRQRLPVHVLPPPAAREVSERWRRPTLVQSEQASAVVYFEIDREGQLRGEPKIKQSSGNELYDQSALRAVAESLPFPPLPREFPGQYLQVHFGFDPGLNRG